MSRAEGVAKNTGVTSPVGKECKLSESEGANPFLTSLHPLPAIATDLEIQTPSKKPSLLYKARHYLCTRC